MSKPCPLLGIAISQDCVDCEGKPCQRSHKYNNVCIGIDQSYKNCGISISGDGKILKIRSLNLEKYKSNSDRREALKSTLNKIINTIMPSCGHIVCVIERIRLRSEGFLNIDYIKSIGALNSIIVDVCHSYNINVYSVDTRCWKAQVVGTSKPAPNVFGVPEEKWPTIRWLLKQGWEKDLLIPITGKKKKGTFVRGDQRYMYNNDAADSACISLFYFVGDRNKLQLEK